MVGSSAGQDQQGTRGEGEGRDQEQDGGSAPALEWIAAALGLLLTLGMLGFIGWNALRDTGTSPPAIEVRVTGIVPAANGYVVEVAAENRSPATAAAVQIEGELKQNGRSIATSQTTLDYVPGHSERHGGLFFQLDPRAHQLEVRALGYARP